MKPSFRARIGTVEYTDRAEFEAAAKVWRKTQKVRRVWVDGRVQSRGGVYPDTALTGTNHGLVSRARGRWRTPARKALDLTRYADVQVAEPIDEAA